MVFSWLFGKSEKKECVKMSEKWVFVKSKKSRNQKLKNKNVNYQKKKRKKANTYHIKHIRIITNYPIQ